MPRPLWVLSALLAVTHLGMAWAYVDPRFVPRPLGPGQVSVVRYIEALGPFWIAGFGATAVGIALVLWRFPARLWIAHLLGLSVSAAYATAAWTGSLMSDPPSPIITAVLASSLAAVHGLAVWVAARVVR
ncbi:MAG TPA: hypothetical protein VF069_18770 [Streptosporangiaceae bacterium]